MASINKVTKPDPYCGFKSDVERRKALGTLVRWRALSVVAVSVAFAAANDKVHLTGLLAWLKQLSA